METWIVPGVLATLVFGARAAQEGKPPAPAPQEQAATPDEKLDGIVERMQAQREAASEEYQAATTDEERDAALRKWQGREFLAEFRALAEEVRGTDAAARAWMWVLQLDPEDAQESIRIVERMLEDHMESEVLSELAGYLGYATDALGERPVTEALRAMIDGSPHAVVQAGALFSLGTILLAGKGDERRAEGRKLLERIVAEFPGVDSGRGTFGVRATAYLFELDHLQIGMPAPDFETVDENGVKWKLSDYRGKVVVVDFWGFW
jgi:hypothetical protein